MQAKQLSLPSALALCALATSASGQTVTVTLCADTVDINPATATVLDLPGPDGEVSLSEALIAANNTPGHQTIEFRIPMSNWQLQFIYPGRAVVNSSLGTYWRAFDEVTLDATTQTAFTGDTNPDGGEVALYGSELYLNADNSTFRGFDSTSVTASRSNALIESNMGTTNITLFGGSGSMVRGNTGGTIKIDRSNNNVVVGNTVLRVRIWGFGSPQLATGNRIGGPNPEDRNFITGYGTWSTGGHPRGSTVELFDNKDTLIENNWIGTTPDGMAQGSQASTVGIEFTGENHDVMVRDNLIAGILGHGRGPHYLGLVFGQAVLIAGTGSGLTFVGNTLGLDASGAPVLGSVTGIDAGDSFAAAFSDVRIGGLGLGEGNTIAGHRLNGVTVGRTMSGARLIGNSIYQNGALGIDLVPSGFGYGVTPNDPLDADTGGNGLQNFPVITTAARMGSMIRMVGTLNSTPLTGFTLEFQTSASCDPTGFGEGRNPLGTTTVTTDGAGNASFDVLLSDTVPGNLFATATATAEPVGSTSEFSACVPVSGTMCQADLGFGGPGVASLSFCGGDLSSGTSADLLLRNAAPNQLAFFVACPTSSPTPLFGGTVVPIPPTIIDIHTTDGTGAVSLYGINGGGGPQTLYGQFVYLDPTQPQGWGISNALRVDFLP